MGISRKKEPVLNVKAWDKACWLWYQERGYLSDGPTPKHFARAELAILAEDNFMRASDEH